MPTPPQLMQKVRGREVGHSYVERRLLALGARPLRAGVDPAVWVWDALDDVHAVRLRHGGNLRYVMLTSRAARRQVLLRLPGGRDAEPGSCLVGTLGFLAGRGITGCPTPNRSTRCDSRRRGAAASVRRTAGVARPSMPHAEPAVIGRPRTNLPPRHRGHRRVVPPVVAGEDATHRFPGDGARHREGGATNAHHTVRPANPPRTNHTRAAYPGRRRAVPVAAAGVAVNPAAIPRMACRTCTVPLNRYIDMTTGQVTYTHPLNSRVDMAGHEPDPAPMDEIDTRRVCDFCGDGRIAYTVRTTPITSVADTGRGRVVDRYGTDWSACYTCAGHLQANDINGLRDHVRHNGPPLDRAEAAAVHVIQQAVLHSLLPGWTLAAIGRWPATPLPAGTLPKVRDRLATLFGGELGLPLGLDEPEVRACVADSVAVARLFWIDPEFTDLADYAAGSLPATTLTPVDLPAPHGLLAWAHPVGPRADLVAASWSSGPQGLRVVGYRSIGAGLPPTPLQQLREQLGWLGPRVHTHLPPGDPVDAASPAAVLVATWLLIAQRLAETTPVEVDKAIRKAYQRSGRPTPEVRLVRIRGTNPTRRTGAATPRPDGDRPATPHEYRWWVKAHWRKVAYGPGRTLRRPFLVVPQVRGPKDKPIKASTVVRMLAAAPPPPGQTSRNGPDQ